MAAASSGSSRHPSAPAFCAACSAFFAPGMGTAPFAMIQFRATWLGVANERWRLISPADAVFADVEAGRAVLVNAARSHAARSQGRVVDRCVVLADDGAGRHRLWNISPVETAAQSLAVGSDVAAD